MNRRVWLLFYCMLCTWWLRLPPDDDNDYILFGTTKPTEDDRRQLAWRSAKNALLSKAREMHGHE